MYHIDVFVCFVLIIMKCRPNAIFSFFSRFHFQCRPTVVRINMFTYNADPNICMQSLCDFRLIKQIGLTSFVMRVPAGRAYIA